VTTKTKPKRNELYVCVESFASDHVSVPQGTRLRGNDERVQKYPDFFEPDMADHELEHVRAKRAAAAVTPPPKPLGRVRLRVVLGRGAVGPLDGGPPPQTVFANGREYYSGETFEGEGKSAQYVIDAGACEIVKHLPAKKHQQPEPGDTGHEAA